MVLAVFVSPGGFRWTVECCRKKCAWHTRRSAKKTKRQSVRTFFLNDSDSVASTLFPDAPEIVASLVSPTGKHLAVLRETTDSASKKRFGEVRYGLTDQRDTNQEEQ